MTVPVIVHLRERLELDGHCVFRAGVTAVWISISNMA